MSQPTLVQALNGSNVPVTGLTPTWLFYGSVGGTSYASDRRPDWKELGNGNYVFNPYAADKTNGAVWVADFGATVAQRYRWGFIGTGYRAFLRVAGGVPAGTTNPTVSSYFNDLSTVSPAGTVVNLTASQAGLFLIQEPVVGSGSSQRRPWTDKGSSSQVDFGASVDALYRYQIVNWGYGTVVALDLAQFNIMPSWPASLPQEPFGEESATYAPMTNVARTDNETGPHQYRRRYSGRTVENFSFILILKPSQMAALDDFYRVTLREVGQFTWLDFRTMRAANYRFAGPPVCEYFASEQSPLGHWWRVQVQLEMV